LSYTQTPVATDFWFEFALRNEPKPDLRT